MFINNYLLIKIYLPIVFFPNPPFELSFLRLRNESNSLPPVISGVLPPREDIKVEESTFLRIVGVFEPESSLIFFECVIGVVVDVEDDDDVVVVE